MLRLLLGLVVAIGILWGGLQLIRSRSQATGATPGPGGPPAARKIVDDYKKIEAQNRAAMERTMNTAEEAR
jgi:hypothetical protein